MGLGKYIKKAFLNHWNLLVFLGGMGFAMLSGHPDVFVPLVLAGEAAYLGVVGTHPKFQRYVDVQEHKAAREQGSAAVGEAFDRILKALPPRQLRRFQALRERCASLRQIAQQMRASEEPGGSESAAARGPPALRPGPAALDLPPPALHPAHARAVLRADQRGADRGRDPAARGADRPPARRGGDRAPPRGSPSARHSRTTWRPVAAGWRTSRRPGRTTSWSRPRSSGWRARSARSPSWPSTVRTPSSSPARSTRWPTAWSRPSRP